MSSNSPGSPRPLRGRRSGVPASSRPSSRYRETINKEASRGEDMTSVRVRGIIFDFDGVLVDSEPVRFKAGAQALAEVGVSLTWENFLTMWLGRTDHAGLRDILGA